MDSSIDMFEKRSLFWMTKAIAQGGFPLDEDFASLRAAGVTHLVNLDLPYRSATSLGPSGFTDLVLMMISDGRRLPERKALEILDALHAILSRPGMKVYVHCKAGISRSPTIVWLYLVACGKDPDEVARRMVAGSPFAIPGNPALVDEELLEKAREHGRTYYQPHPRPEVLEWV